MLYDIYHRPAALDLDYGEPTELCHETAANSGVFVRQWTVRTSTHFTAVLSTCHGGSNLHPPCRHPSSLAHG